MYPLDEIRREVSVHALDPAWKAAIAGANTEAELIELASTFVENASPREMDALPSSCRPRRITSAGDLSLVAFRLRRAYCSPSLDNLTAARIERVLAFFEALCDRIFDLRLAA